MTTATIYYGNYGPLKVPERVLWTLCGDGRRRTAIISRRSRLLSNVREMRATVQVEGHTVVGTVKLFGPHDDRVFVPDPTRTNAFRLPKAVFYTIKKDGVPHSVAYRDTYIYHILQGPLGCRFYRISTNEPPEVQAHVADLSIYRTVGGTLVLPEHIARVRWVGAQQSCRDVLAYPIQATYIATGDGYARTY